MTTVVLSPLRKQGDVSKIPTAPTAVLLQGSIAPPMATLPRTQGSSTPPTATLACTQGSGTSLPGTLAHSYTPIIHLDPLLASIKGRSRASMREGRAGERADEQDHSLSLSLSLSLSRTLVTPTTSASPWRRITRAAFSPLVFHLAPTHLGRDTQRQIYSSVQGPHGVEMPTVGAPGRGLLRVDEQLPVEFQMGSLQQPLQPGTALRFGVSSSCPSTAATTWYSSPRSATATTTAVSSPGGGELDDVFPPWRKGSIQARPAVFLAAGGGGGGATMARQEAAPRRLSSESTTPTPQRGTCRALSSRLRQRQMSFPRNMPTPSRQMTPAPSWRTCWALASYLR
jgi:hypothetical protein